MYVLLGKPQSIVDIKTNILPFTSDVRSKVPIAIIDDEKFAYESLLRDHTYNIKIFDDIDDVRSLEAFPIILSDIKGVGKRFKSKYEGGHLWLQKGCFRKSLNVSID